MSHFRDMAEAARGYIDTIYHALEGNEDLLEYHQRHGTPSLLVLTQYHEESARELARLLAKDIDGKTVIEIGAGVGFLAVEMAKRAKHVWAVEVDPAWSWCFTRTLYRVKPANLTWIFGRAEDVADWLRADVAVVCGRSGLMKLGDIGHKIAKEVIYPLQEQEAATP